MATIGGQTSERIYGIPKWGGLNEHPDGDTRIKLGEAAHMVNWRITRDGNLKRRPGTEFITGLCASYNAVPDNTLTKLGVHDGSEEYKVFDTVSAEAAPGTITLGNIIGNVKHGVLSGISENADVDDGILDFPASDGIAVSGGMLYSASAGDVTVSLETLYGMLAELDDSEYYYTRIDEVPYALNANCLRIEGGKYELFGYRVVAHAQADSKQPVAGMWTGRVADREVFLAACNGHLWNLYDPVEDAFIREHIGSLNTDKGVSFIPFDGKVYILNGYEYYVWDGEEFGEVEGYRPLVAVSISPDLGGGSASGELTGEYINRLNGERRVWLSPDGENDTFQMPEGGTQEDPLTLDWVTDTATGEAVSGTYTFDGAAGTITFSTPPAKSVNSIEVAYTSPNTLRDQVTGNLFAELFAGTTDTRIFIYGDGSNRALYTGMDYDGMPRADYFPDQYEVHVGDSNTPITSMIRHYGTLVTYKPGECWNLQHGVMDLASGDLTPAIYSTPVNREKGNVAPGQVRLVNNSPVTCSGSELYQWTNSSYYTSNLTRDERQARRISDRIQKSIKDLDFTQCCMWDDDDNQEFYIAGHGIALVWNYAADAWYRYEDIDVVKMCSFHGEVYLGSSEGRILRLTDTATGDEGYPINAEWISGAMDFGAGYMRKYAAQIWVGLKPQKDTSVEVCVQTDRKNTFHEKDVYSEKAKVPGEAFMTRIKLKAKKFVYYKLKLEVHEKMPPVTVTDIQIRVRQTGYAK